MKLLKNISINRKLTLLVAAAVAVALTLSSGAFIYSDIQRMRTSTVEQLSTLADVLGSNTAAAITFDDSESAGQILSSLRNQPMVVGACVYDSQRRVFATYSRSAAGQFHPDTAPEPGIEFTSSDYLEISQPIVVEGDHVGTIYLRASLEGFHQEVVEDAATTGVIMVIAFCVSHLLASRLQRGISGPILVLAKTAERISSEADYSIRVQREGDDELGVLYDNFNHMVQQVEAGKRDLEEAHKKLERLSEEKMRAVVETAADGVITFVESGVIESCNGASCELFDYDRSDLIGCNFMNLLPDTQDKCWEQVLHDRLGVNESFNKCGKELTGRRKNGTIVPISLSLSAFATDSGRLFTAILRDLTDHKRMQLELAQAQKLEAIGQLAAGVAHEINTPMQFVSDNIEFLSDCSQRMFEVVDAFQRNLFTQGQQRSWAERRQELEDMIVRNKFEDIRTQVPQAISESLEGIQRVIHIVRAMKEFSHPGFEEKVGVDLNNAICSTVTITRNRWKYVAELEMDLDPDLPTLNCIPADINQVLLNLIVNAADAIAEKVGEGGQKGQITVRSGTDGENVVIEVEDTGCGIPDEIRARIFDPFFTTKDVGKGTGQGLAICYNVVVNKHKGTIDVQSTPGEGTTFRVSIPRRATSPSEAEPSPPNDNVNSMIDWSPTR